MNKLKYPFLFLFLVYFNLNAFTQTNNCSHPDYAVMLDFAKNIQDIGGTLNWDTTQCDVCVWNGVTCNELGRITILTIGGIVTGPIPNTIGQLTFLEEFTYIAAADGLGPTGNLPTSIGQLKNLKKLEITGTFTGLSGVIPPEIGGLTSLESLKLSSFNLRGTLPFELGQLTNLKSLQINQTQIRESIPSQIGQLSNLEILDISQNLLTGALPPEIGNLSQLRILNLNKEQGNMTTGSNRFTGPIPPEYGKLENVEEIYINYGIISGTLPLELLNLEQLKVFEVQARFTGRTGAFNQGELMGCFDPAFKIWCDRGVAVNLIGHPNLPWNGDFTKFCETGLGTEDADGDGICNGEDCNDNNPTLPSTPDGPCDDGNPNTINDKIGEDGCTCVGTPIDGGSANCTTLTFTPSNNQITLSTLTPHSKVEIIGKNTNWQVQTICDGDCMETQTIPNLMAGEYTVKVNLSSSDGSHCYREEKVSVSGGSNTGGKANCNNLTFTGENGQITISGLTASYDKVEILGKNTDWQVLTICDGDCSDTQIIPDLKAGDYAVKVNQGGNDGSYCYREERVTVGSSNTGGSANCDNLMFTASDGAITVSNLTASYDKVEIIGRNTNWQVVTICEGDCAEAQIIPDLAIGEYAVKVNQGGSDGTYCYREEMVAVTSSSSNRNSAIDYNKELVLYPNPARNEATLRSKSLKGKTGNIQIFDTFGRLIQSFSGIEFTDNQSLNLNDFENGIYWLSVQVGGELVVGKRFVVETLR